MKEKFLLKIQNISKHVLFLTLGLGLTVLGDMAGQMPECSRQAFIFTLRWPTSSLNVMPFVMFHKIGDCMLNPISVIQF